MKPRKICAGVYQVGPRQVARVIPTFHGRRIRGGVRCVWVDVASGTRLGYTLKEAIETINRDARKAAL